MEEEKLITEETKEERLDSLANSLKERGEQMKKKQNESFQAMMEGKGRLHLEKPILSGDEEIEELSYDFTELTGMDYVNAMDMDHNAVNAFKATYKQHLALFAAAAAKQTPGLDMRDIMERIWITDATAGAQLAALFFNASTRAGQMRISKL